MIPSTNNCITFGLRVISMATLPLLIGLHVGEDALSMTVELIELGLSTYWHVDAIPARCVRFQYLAVLHEWINEHILMTLRHSKAMIWLGCLIEYTLL
jgi:hypothetical protein